MCTSLDALFLVHLRLAHLIENLINRNLNGFRFLKEEKEDLILQSQIVSTSTNLFNIFECSSHSCPVDVLGLLAT